jgi:hypothetical protein
VARAHFFAGPLPRLLYEVSQQGGVDEVGTGELAAVAGELLAERIGGI